MAEPPSPRKKAWRNNAGPTPAHRGVDEAWRTTQGAKPTGPSFWSRRKRRFLFVTSGLFAVTLAIVFLVWLLRPAPPIRLVLIGAGYETNLAVPHNVPGANGLNALHSWAQSYTAREKDRSEVRRATLTKDFDDAQRNLEPPTTFGKAVKTLAVYVSAHGLGVPDDGGGLTPCLVGNDDDLADPKALIPLDRVLDALKKFPEKTRKLLILDCTSVRAHWPLGMVHNDFARALKGKTFADRVAAVPNLTVLCASDEGQRSWADLEWGQTAFSHYVLEGLRGKAEGKGGGRDDGRIDARELCAYVIDEVERWAKYNRARSQKPVVLGDKYAKDTELVGIRDSTDAGKRQQGDMKELEEQGWKQADGLLKVMPHPAVYTPHLWRRYLETLLRAEELLRWGESDKAAALRDQAKALHKRIEGERSHPLNAAQLTLAMPAALGAELSKPEQDVLKKFTDAWEDESQWQDGKQPEACKKILKDMLENAGGRRVLLRAQATGAVLHEIAAAPDRHWQAGLQLLEDLDPPESDCRPAEVHYLTMLQPRPDDAKKAPAAAVRDSKGGAALLHKALAVRIVAEQAALGLGQDKDSKVPAYSEEVRPWIAAIIHKADAKRRLGEDLLFTTDPEEWKNAEAQLDDARTLYGDAQALALQVRAALFQRDRALAVLPYYSRWVAERDPDGRANSVVLLWQKVHELRKALETRTPEAKPQTGAALEEMAGKVRSGVDQLEQLVRNRAQEGVANAVENQDTWHEIEATLAVPFLDAGARHGLSVALEKVSTRLHEDAEKAGPGKAIDLKDEKGLDFAKRQSRLALAVLGAGKDADADPDDLNEALGKTKEPEEGAWYLSLDRAGTIVGKVFNRRATEAEEFTKQAAKLGVPEAESKLLAAARDARQVDGGVTDRLTQDPVGARRKLLLHDLLCWQTERAYLDFWADKKPGEFYFRRAGRLFLKDARELAASPEASAATVRQEQVNTWDRRLKEAAPVVAEWSPNGSKGSFKQQPEDIHLTDETNVQRYYHLLGPAAGEVPGQPVWWVEVEGPALPPPDPDRRKVRFDDILPVYVVKDGGTGAGNGETYHVVNGFFRGHHPAVRTHIIPQPHPDLVWYEPPVQPRARVAVQTRKGLYDVLGADNAAVALVLDLSGSMNGKEDGVEKHLKAKKALEKVLEQMPDGVIVSLRVFGQADFKGDDFLAKRGGISQIWAPKPWDQAQLTKKIKQVDALKPYSSTPLLRAIAMAADEDLPSDRLARSIVVITDGGDSNWYSPDNLDADLKQATGARTIKEFLLRKFANSGVKVSVIGYHVGDAPAGDPTWEIEKKAADELPAALRAIDGDYLPAEDSSKLEEFLKRSVLHMYFQVYPDLGADSAGDDYRGNQISRQDVPENPAWVEPLRPRPYRLRLPTIGVGRRALPEQRIELGRGDALVLDLVAERGSLPTFRRALYAECEYLTQRHHVIRAQRKEGWLLAGLQNQQKQGTERLNILATLEKDVREHRLTINQVRPQWAWFEVPAPKKGASPPPLQITPVSYDYPAPAWQIEARTWPVGVRSTLSAWWTEQELRPMATLEKDVAFQQLPADLARRRHWATEPGQGEVNLEGVTLERLKVRVGPDQQPQERECLVVRLSFPAKAEPFFVRLPDWDQDHGQEHRFYRGAGKYTGVFWPASRDDVDRVRSIRLFSVGKLKNDKGSLRVEELDLKVPDDTPAPTP
jgi:hypothetical protein